MEFTRRLIIKTIRVLIPQLFREVFPDNPTCLAAADNCETAAEWATPRAALEWIARAAEWAADAARAWTTEATRATTWATDAKDAEDAEDAAAAAAAATWAAEAARAWTTEAAARATTWATWTAWAADAAAAAAAEDKYLILSASLALEVLRELNSPGVALLLETK